MKSEYFAKGTGKCKILCTLMGKEVENWEDQGCPKVHDLVDEEMWFSLGYPSRQKTRLHSAERKANLLGNSAMQHLSL